jgi:hypothetical protein
VRRQVLISCKSTALSLTNLLPIGRLRRNRHIGALEKRRREREKTTCTDRTQRHSVSDLPGALREMAPAYRVGRRYSLGYGKTVGPPVERCLRLTDAGVLAEGWQWQDLSHCAESRRALFTADQIATLVAVQKVQEAASTSCHAPSSPIRSFRIAPCITGSAWSP